MEIVMRIFTALSFACLFCPAAAQATTLTFDFPSQTEFSSYAEGGFNFTQDTGQSDGLLSWGSAGGNDADPSASSATLLPNYQSETITMSAAGGGAFSVTSIDFSDAYNSGVADEINLAFHLADGTTLNSVASLDANPGLQTFVFAVTNVVSLSWVTPGFGYGDQFDNIVADVSGVPLPATMPLLASALGGLGLIGWMRRKFA
jgi:hypothetical protein